MRKALSAILGFVLGAAPSVGALALAPLGLPRLWAAWRLADTLFLVSGGLLLAISAAAGAISTAAVAVLTSWLMVRGVELVARTSPRSGVLVDGLMAGLGLTVAVSVGRFLFASANRGDTWWAGHPNITGHALLLFGIALASRRSGRSPARTVTLVVGVSLILFAPLFTGSRSTLLGAVIAMGALLTWALQRNQGPRKSRVLVPLGLLAIGGAFVLAASLLWPSALARVTAGLNPIPVIQSMRSTSSTNNHFLASEDLTLPPWEADGVTVNRQNPQTSDAGRNATWLLARSADYQWARIQQEVRLLTDRTYSIQGVVGVPEPVTRHETLPGGILGFADTRQGALWVEGRFADDTWVGTGSEFVTVESASARRLPTGAWRVAVSFNVSTDAPVSMKIGFAPDLRRVDAESSARMTLSQPQLEQASQPTPYRQNTGVAIGRSEVLSRLNYWRGAAHGFLASPLYGHPGTAFRDYYLASLPPGASASDLPNHAHNVVLEFLYRHGALGLLALATWILALRWSGIALLPLVVIMAVNMVDVTMFSTVVLVPLAVSSMTTNTRVRNDRTSD